MLALPLMLLIVGSIETSRFVWTRHALQDAASVGARCIGLRVPPCFADTAFNRAATQGLVQERAASWAVGLSDDAIALHDDAVCAGASGFARVEITHSFRSVIAGMTDVTMQAEGCFPVMR